LDVTMPQLGETVTEGTITRWFKQVGEQVAADEPLFEVSTDKVDSEVPEPQAGVVAEILVPEGETVPVGARLAVISDSADGSAPAPAAAAAPAEAEAPAKDAAPAPEPQAAPAAAPQPPQPPPAPAPAAAPPPPPPAPAPEPAAQPAPQPVAQPVSATAGIVASPIVRRLIAEHGLDPSQIQGTGDGGRITRNDVLAAARNGGGAARTQTAPAPAPAQPAPAQPSPAPAPPQPALAPAPMAGDTVIPFDNIRRRTAEHMVRSKATSAHVYTSVRVDFERVERTRQAHQAEWKVQEGATLTYLPFIVRAFCDVVREFPHVNASVDGDSLVVHHDVNLGIAVDLDYKGLIAPVIKNADGKRLRLIAREIRDLAARAKTKQLGPDEVVGGTFTVTNMGPFGTTLTLPIINQPQVAILATDGIRKEPVVIEGPDGEDTIAVHHVGHLALAWDHRAFDGAYAAAFLNSVRTVLETRDWDAELA
jgi:2-oxoglutarate dehydrogenase E2 component (dihydrolipoamide succinyltransferase)